MSFYVFELSSLFCQDSETLEAPCLHPGCVVCVTGSRVKVWAGRTRLFLLCGTSEPLREAWGDRLVQLLGRFFYNLKMGLCSF